MWVIPDFEGNGYECRRIEDISVQTPRYDSSYEQTPQTPQTPRYQQCHGCSENAQCSDGLLKNFQNVKLKLTANDQNNFFL